MSIEELQNILLHGKNDAERDDAAEFFAQFHWQDRRSQEILVEAVNSGLLDESLKLTCVESLGQIWIKQGTVDKQLYERLDKQFQSIVDHWLKTENGNQSKEQDT